MGLDITFNRKQAEEAGMFFKVIPNDGIYDEEDDPAYIQWCLSSTECIQVPGQDHFVANDSGDPNRVMVRANKWGNTYYPLTDWLTKHEIKWSEF